MVSLIIDDHIPFLKGVLEPYAKIIYAKGGNIDNRLALKADGIIIRTRTFCNEGLLKGTPVRFIATATIGFDHIDTEYCSGNSIGWHHAPGCNASSVMQYIASALVKLAIKHGFSLQGKKIGIIGAGNVGSKVASLASALGMIPLLNDPPRERAEKQCSFVSLGEIQETADIVTFHVPLTSEGEDRTFHLADKGFFDKLRRNPIIINTSRGEVTDTPAVKNALRNGKIAVYAADVWEDEPCIDLELLGMAEIGTPHIAGYSLEGKANGTAACVRAASRFFGFGLDNWYPSVLTPPENPMIEIDAKGKTKEQVIAEAILASYDVMKDDVSFRTSPARFEELRNFYPVRREFGAFILKIDSPRPDIMTSLQTLGFNAPLK